jgi:hypothetical protein
MVCRQVLADAVWPILGVLSIGLTHAPGRRALAVAQDDHKLTIRAVDGVSTYSRCECHGGLAYHRTFLAVKDLPASIAALVDIWALH